MNELSPRFTLASDGGPLVIFDQSWLMQSVASWMIRFRGAAMQYMQAMTPNGDAYKTFCRGYHMRTGTQILFSRDEGMHSSGWWKNPDYERCLHLSLSFFETGESGAPGTRKPKSSKLSERWVECFFGSQAKWLWCEPPVTPEGKLHDVWHYRLFVDEGWQPIKPRGEVYTREFTEAGWKSYSDVQYEKRINGHAMPSR